MNPWILGSFARDFSMLALPALAAFTVSRTFNFGSQLLSTFLILFLVYGFIDNGHVWTTLWRTYADPAEWSRRKRALILVPACIALALFSWSYLGAYGLWSLAAAATLYHNIRQLWGFVRWYEKLAGKRRKSTFWTFHSLVLLPVLAYITRPLPPDHFYIVAGDIWHFPQPAVFWTALWAWILVFSLFVFMEIRLYFLGVREPGRIYGISAAALIYGGAFFLSDSILDLAFPLVATHGLSYLAVMAQTSRRLSGSRPYFLIWASLLFTALIGGAFAYALMENFEFGKASTANPVLSLAIMLYFTPVLSHYAFDAWLWTGSHPDAKKVFAAHG